jgi:hypothetical protein
MEVIWRVDPVNRFVGCAAAVYGISAHAESAHETGRLCVKAPEAENAADGSGEHAVPDPLIEFAAAQVGVAGDWDTCRQVGNRNEIDTGGYELNFWRSRGVRTFRSAARAPYWL